VLKQPPPNFFAPYPAIRALSQLGIIKSLLNSLKYYAIALKTAEEK